MSKSTLSSKMRFSHQFIDERNAAHDRMIAKRLRCDSSVLRRARNNLRRWMSRDGKRPRPVFVEWRRILEYLTAGEIADFLESDTPMARRLRQSSPFIGPSPEKRLTRSQKKRGNATSKQRCGQPPE
jgi:hypothetical protein